MFICGAIRLVYKVYEVTTIFNQQQLDYLRELYYSLPKRFYTKYITLFNIERRDVINLNNFMWNDIVRVQCEHTENLVPKKQYFLNYTKNSFCTVHQDNPSAVKQTSITLIEKSNDLDGGDIYLRTPVNKDELRVGDIVNHPQEKSNFLKINEDVVPEIVKQRVGETVWYSSGTHHGVTKVKAGNRIVLVTWFGEQDEKN